MPGIIVEVIGISVPVELPTDKSQPELADPIEVEAVREVPGVYPYVEVALISAATVSVVVCEPINSGEVKFLKITE
jgi:hypothetical protein